ncbi:DUF4274 domain-containing protein [uncultured Kordia sp.]|uniref:DUF4274 domain-containing protein n=1 Tax=uncultured Kordia sp. TaxID=507699 RepID=UPI002630286B|nr:DUF4274 domain-containing protein [uncultured Kordia sp.]
MKDFFFRLQDRIYKFIENDITPKESKETYAALKAEITELDKSDFREHSNHFVQMLDCHHKRHVDGVSFEDFMNMEFPEPTVRVGRLPVDFNEENYDFMKTLGKNTKMTVQELADFMWWNKYYPQFNVDIDTGEIIQIDTRSKGRTFNFSKIPNISKLKKLKKVNISHVTDEVIDFTKIAPKSLYLKKLDISSITEVKKIILTGTIEECEFNFVENLESLDCTRIDLLDSYYFTTFYCKNNGPCIITDAQKNHPSPFSKFRWKKELVKSTAEEIDTLAAGYNWDNGTKFLRWAIKQPQCDKGTALHVYWHGAPEWYTQFKSKKEVDEWAQDGFALLAAIERRVKKDDFASYNYKFNINKHLNNKPVNYPENKVRDIPEFMFVND